MSEKGRGGKTHLNLNQPDLGFPEIPSPTASNATTTIQMAKQTRELGTPVEGKLGPSFRMTRGKKEATGIIAEGEKKRELQLCRFKLLRET